MFEEELREDVAEALDLITAQAVELERGDPNGKDVHATSTVA
jgi:hypothetical protein